LQKRLIILRSLLTEATPYPLQVMCHTSEYTHELICDAWTHMSYTHMKNKYVMCWTEMSTGVTHGYYQTHKDMRHVCCLPVCVLVDRVSHVTCKRVTWRVNESCHMDARGRCGTHRVVCVTSCAVFLSASRYTEYFTRDIKTNYITHNHMSHASDTLVTCCVMYVCLQHSCHVLCRVCVLYQHTTSVTHEHMRRVLSLCLSHDRQNESCHM